MEGATGKEAGGADSGNSKSPGTVKGRADSIDPTEYLVFLLLFVGTLLGALSLVVIF